MKGRAVLFGVAGVVGLLGAASGCVLAWPPWPAPVVASRMEDLPPVRLASTAQPLPGRVGIVRVAHASVLLDFDGEVILTDPWFTDTEEYHHGEPLAHAVADLPRLAGVVVSHDHYDHFDIRAFAAYRDKAVPFFVAPGLGQLAREAGFTNVHELPPWQSGKAGNVTITAAPAAHGVPEVTYVIQGTGGTVYFGADTKLIAALETDLPKRFPVIDVALLPVNGLRVAGEQVVMNDQEAARLAGELRAAVAVPIHYMFRGGIVSDTFVLSYHGSAEGFVKAAATQAPGTEVRILMPGQRLEIGHVAAASLPQ